MTIKKLSIVLVQRPVEVPAEKGRGYPRHAAGIHHAVFCIENICGEGSAHGRQHGGVDRGTPRAGTRHDGASEHGRGHSRARGTAVRSKPEAIGIDHPKQN